jgi:hypothetical protein
MPNSGTKRLKKATTVELCFCLVLGLGLLLHFARWNFSSGRLGKLQALLTVDSPAKKNKYPAIDTTHTEYAHVPSLQMTYTTLGSNRFYTVFYEKMMPQGTPPPRRHFVADTRWKRKSCKAVTRLWRFIRVYEAVETWSTRATVMYLNCLTTEKALISIEM